MSDFKLQAPFEPTGDQPEAIAKLVEGLQRGDKFQTLLGVTGSGKTFTIASVIAQVQRPTLVIAHNKTLAAQLCSEFREFFPENAVEYFVSYYDYYQPEAYIPQTDTYIEKDASINSEIERLRYSATQSVLERRDVIVVASVSSIYGLGSPTEYREIILTLEIGQEYPREDVLRRLVDMQFSRNDIALGRGTFRVRGDVLEIQPMHEEIVTRVEFFGDQVERITNVDPLTGEVIAVLDKVTVFPASHFITPYDKMEMAIANIEKELQERIEFFRAHGKPLEAERIEQRTRFDIEMMREVGYCSGIENYSRHLDFRAPGTPPYTLIDYFPDEYLLVLDESHQTIPQLHGMYNGDRSRKETLVEFGFRLPSALDNRPLKFHELEQRMGQVIFMSATPGPYELKQSAQVVEQLIRPTFLVDPELEVRPTQHQVDDLVEEIRKRTEQGERVLVTTLTKKMAEDLSEYLLDLGIKVHYLHSEIQTLERLEILRDLRLGVYDALVGINLLREGLDLPEVSLVAILDADREGFLRSATSLIQVIGRAARNAAGKVLMYADQVTEAMNQAISETNRRRAKQLEYNEAHGVSPETIRKAVSETIRAHQVAETRERYGVGASGGEALSLDEVMLTLANLEREMKAAAKALEFERAAEVRDEITRIKKLLPDVKW